MRPTLKVKMPRVLIFPVTFLPLTFLIAFATACSSSPTTETASTQDADRDIVSETPAGKKTQVHATQNSVDPNARHILLLGLDGVGYTEFKKMQIGGHFRSFRPVAPMVASFPSISDPNWAKILRAPLEVSFTKEHFDRNLKNGNGEISGGLIDHVFNPPTYEKSFDFKPEGALQHLASMTYSEVSGIYWLDVLKEKLFENAGKRIFTAFIVNTDFISHTKGESSIYKYLFELDRKIEKLRQDYQAHFGRTLDVILVSDHGNVFLKPKAVEVEGVLKNAGWNSTNSLVNPRDVVYVVPEILSFAPFYVRKNQEEELAKTVSRAEGVHVAFYLSAPDHVDFFSRGGLDHTRAFLNHKNKTVSYYVIKGVDPFGQMPLFRNGPLGLNGYFHETLGSDYPNALVRAFEGLTQNSIQKPSVLVSSKLGYVFSNKTLEIITKMTGLESVHGSFHRKESLGIFVSTSTELPPVYPNIVLDYVR